MKVCFVSHSAYRGGAEQALIETIEALGTQGIESYVLLPCQGPLCTELMERGITFSILTHRPWMGRANTSLRRRFKNALITLGMLIPAAWMIKKWKCDIVYTNTITIWIGAIVAALIHKPHVWHIHEFGEEDHGLTFLYGKAFSMKILKCFSSICIANSAAVAGKYKKYVSPSKLNVVYQSVSLTIQNTSVPASKRFRCTIVGKISPGKGQEDAIRAIGDLVHRGIPVELYIVGDAAGYEEYKDYLTAIVKRNDLMENVYFIGYSEYPFEYMRASDVILMCSRCEAFGRVTVEGMLAGKPIVGARGGGTIELVKDGFNGYLYTPGDYGDLAEKIVTIYNHLELGRTMGENGQRWASEYFSQKRYGSEMFEILLSAVKGKRCRPIVKTGKMDIGS